MRSVEITVTSDFSCPWCWIGHQHLQRALRQLPPRVTAQVRYAPLELAPGAARSSAALETELTLAGLRAGLRFDYGRIAPAPSTRAAHRLMDYAQRLPAPAVPGLLFEAIFAAHFSHGRDIGDIAVLADLAAHAGLSRQSVRDYLAGAQPPFVLAVALAQEDGDAQPGLR